MLVRRRLAGLFVTYVCLPSQAVNNSRNTIVDQVRSINSGKLLAKKTTKIAHAAPTTTNIMTKFGSPMTASRASSKTNLTITALRCAMKIDKQVRTR